MASFFGEVVYSSSRAYDEEDLAGSFEIDVNVSEDKRDVLENCTVLVVSHGAIAGDFSTTVLKPDVCDTIGYITVGRCGCPSGIDTGDFHQDTTIKTPICVTPKGACIVSFSSEVAHHAANQLAKKVLALLPKECVIIALTSDHYGKLYGSYNPEPDCNCVVYSLKSKQFSDKLCVHPTLPPPAAIHSLPAAVLTRSIIEKRSCVLYAAFTETYSTGDLSLVLDKMVQIFSVKPFSETIPLDLNKETLWKYRNKNPRSENLDRYL